MPIYIAPVEDMMFLFDKLRNNKNYNEIEKYKEVNSELVKNSKIKILEYENNRNYREIALCWRMSSSRSNDFIKFTELLKSVV